MYGPAFNDGSDDISSFIPVTGPTGSVPKFDTITVSPNETVGQMAYRAFGANTAAYRARLEHANETLDGAVVSEIRVPR